MTGPEAALGPEGWPAATESDNLTYRWLTVLTALPHFLLPRPGEERRDDDTGSEAQPRAQWGQGQALGAEVWHNHIPHLRPTDICLVSQWGHRTLSTSEGAVSRAGPAHPSTPFARPHPPSHPRPCVRPADPRWPYPLVLWEF